MANTTYLGIAKLALTNPDFNPNGGIGLILNNALDALDGRHSVEVDLIDGAIGIKSGTVIITKAGVAALTLAAPVAGSTATGGDDGKVLRIMDQSTHAHVITAPANKINGNKLTATFGGTLGQVALLVAYNGIWYLDADSSGITLA